MLTSLETIPNHEMKTPLCKHILTCLIVLCVAAQTIWKSPGCPSPEGSWLNGGSSVEDCAPVQ